MLHLRAHATTPLYVDKLSEHYLLLKVRRYACPCKERLALSAASPLGKG
jgi:hypothetical protein